MRGSGQQNTCPSVEGRIASPVPPARRTTTSFTTTQHRSQPASDIRGLAKGLLIGTWVQFAGE